ncbi:MAG: hypothetical protein R3E89_10290 [Thiolinea sp.]
MLGAVVLIGTLVAVALWFDSSGQQASVLAADKTATAPRVAYRSSDPLSRHRQIRRCRQWPL